MRKKWLSRALATVLASVMAVGMLAGCGATETTKESAETSASKVESQTQQVEQTPVEEVTYPVDTDVSLTFHISHPNLAKSAAYVDFNDVPFYKGLSEKTGIDVEWSTWAEGADRFAAFNLLLQEEKLPNIIFTGEIASINTWYDDGLVVDLTPYLEDYAPDFWEFINQPEQELNKKAIMSEDGKFLYFPEIRESDFNITYRGPIIRQDWLDECGLEAPVTLDDWETVLRAFKEKYNAYLGFATTRVREEFIASGVGAFAGTEWNNYYDPETDEIKVGNVQPEWKELLTYLNRWYKDGLIDPDFATATDATIDTKVAENKVGIAFAPMSRLTKYVNEAAANNTGANWVGLSYPRTAPDAPTKHIQTDRQTLMSNVGAFVSTSSTEEEIIAAVKFLNYAFNEEGIVYWNFGEEGVNYEVKDGEYVFTDMMTADGKSLDDSLKDYTGQYSGAFGVQMSALVKAKNSKAAVEAVYTWTENTISQEYKVPSVELTLDEKSRIADIETPVKTYVQEMALKFITGEESLDDFDKFVDQCYAYGLQEYLDIRNAAYQRSK